MTHLYVDLTDDERAKLHALGGPAWIRLQVQAAPQPAGMRGLFGLSPAERAQLLADLPMLGRKATARKYRVKPSTVDVARRGTDVAVDLRRRRTARGAA
jgi:hypothetical protein